MDSARPAAGVSGLPGERPVSATAARRRGLRSLVWWLHATFALLLVQLVVVGAAGAASVVSTSAQLDVLAHRIDPAIEANAEVLRSMLEAQSASRGHRITRQEPFLDPWRRARAELPAAEGRLRGLAATGPLVVPVRRQQDAIDRWWQLALGDDGRPVPEVDQREAKARFDAVRVANADVAVVLDAQRDALTRRAAARRDMLVVALAGTTALTLVVGLLVAGATARWVVAPAARLRRVVERQRLGEHGARAALDGPAEVVGVAVAVNQLAEETGRLREAQREAVRLRQLGHEASRALRELPQDGGAARTALELLGTGLGVDMAWYRPLRHAAAETWARPGLAAPPGGPVPHDDPAALARSLAGAGMVRAVPAVMRSELMNHRAGRAFAGETGAGSMLTAAVTGGDDVLGLLVLVTLLAPREYSEEEVAAVRSVARDLGQSLDEADRWQTQRSLVDRLHDLDRQKTEFLSTVSHELRTPLTSIAGYLELISDGDAGEVPVTMRPMLEVVARSTDRLQALIEDLLTLSKVESGALPCGSDDVDVGRLLRAAGEAVRPQADRGALRLEVTAPAHRLAVRGEEMQLERVLLNLASNAVKFTPAGGSVTLHATAERDGEGRGWAVLHCADSGIGIPEAEQGGLFARFFRASNATAAAVPGTGLGLAIVRGIVEQHGGRLALTSRQGQGTTVQVRLPLAAVTADAARPPAVTAR